VLAGSDGMRLTIGTSDRENRTAAGAGNESDRFGQQRIGCPPPRADLTEQGGARNGMKGWHLDGYWVPTPMMTARLSRAALVSGSAGGSMRSPRATVSVSMAPASVSRPTA
jgi:hypothetical protein